MRHYSFLFLYALFFVFSTVGNTTSDTPLPWLTEPSDDYVNYDEMIGLWLRDPNEYIRKYGRLMLVFAPQESNSGDYSLQDNNNEPLLCLSPHDPESYRGSVPLAKSSGNTASVSVSNSCKVSGSIKPRSYSGTFDQVAKQVAHDFNPINIASGVVDLAKHLTYGVYKHTIGKIVAAIKRKKEKKEEKRRRKEQEAQQERERQIQQNAEQLAQQKKAAEEKRQREAEEKRREEERAEEERKQKHLQKIADFKHNLEASGFRMLSAEEQETFKDIEPVLSENIDEFVQNLENYPSTQGYVDWYNKLKNSKHLYPDKNISYYEDRYTMYSATKCFLRTQSIDIKQYETFSGSVYQHIVHRECIAVFESAARIHQFTQHNHEVSLVVTSTVEMTDAASQFNRKGFINHAMNIAIFAQEVLAGVGEGLVQSVKNTYNMVRHPIQFAIDMAHGVAMIGTLACKIIYYTGREGFEFCRSENRTQRFFDRVDLAKSLCSAAGDQLKQLSARDVSRMTTTFAADIFLQKKVLMGIGKILKHTSPWKERFPHMIQQLVQKKQPKDPSRYTPASKT